MRSAHLARQSKAVHRLSARITDEGLAILNQAINDGSASTISRLTQGDIIDDLIKTHLPPLRANGASSPAPVQAAAPPRKAVKRTAKR